MSNHETDHSGLQCSTDQQSESEEHKLLAEFHAQTIEYEVLPLFESQYKAFVSKRQYSMRTNKMLRNRWLDRLRNSTEVVGQRTMPKVSEYHFYNCRTILNASLTPCNYPTYRHHLKPGPGVDNLGQRPIPADMMLRKSEHIQHKPRTGVLLPNKTKKRTEEASEPHK